MSDPNEIDPTGSLARGLDDLANGRLVDGADPRWQSEPPAEPGWYRVYDPEDKRGYVYEFWDRGDGVMHAGSAYEDQWLIDHRPIEFLPVPDVSTKPDPATGQ
jgi:hypothetical protein